ncbi:MAG: SynChlorMet cassette protein ScmD [Syntrophorhabdales bacterium]
MCVRGGEKPLANPLAILREEFDDWAILYDPDTGNGFGLNPTGLFIWKLLDGRHTIDALLEKMRAHAEDVPEGAKDRIRVFVETLVAEGLATVDDTASGLLEDAAIRDLDWEKYSHASFLDTRELGRITYEPPWLIDFTNGRQARGTTCSTHGSAGGTCSGGTGASTCCYSGGCGTTPANCSCNSGYCGMYDDTNCACTGSCATPNPICYSSGSCAITQCCGTGCCDGVCYTCYTGRSCAGGCSA